MRLYPRGAAQCRIRLENAALHRLPRHHTLVLCGQVRGNPTEHDVGHEQFGLCAMLPCRQALIQGRVVHHRASVTELG